LNIVESFSYKEDKIKMMKELEKIARREGKKKSVMIVDILEEYVKAHAHGNSTFCLDTWQQIPDFRAVPTILSDNQKWRSHLEDCDKEEKLKLLKQANMIRSQIISVGLDKHTRK